MHSRMRWLPLIPAAVAVVALAGCTGTRLEDVWRDPDFDATPLHSVVVVSQRPDAAQRRLWEDAVAAALGNAGVRAVPSYQDWPDGPPSRQQLAHALGDGREDAALIVKPLAGQIERRVVPGYTSVEPREFYNPWTNREVVGVRERRHRGYVVTTRQARAQITLWSGGDDVRMVYGATAVIDASGSGDDVRRDFAKGLATGMRQAGLIPR